MTALPQPSLAYSTIISTRGFGLCRWYRCSSSPRPPRRGSSSLVPWLQALHPDDTRRHLRRSLPFRGAVPHQRHADSIDKQPNHRSPHAELWFRLLDLALLHGSGRLNQWLARLLSSRALYVIAQLSYSMLSFTFSSSWGFTRYWSLTGQICKRCDGDVGRRNHLFSAYAHHLDWGLSFCRASRYRVEESVTRLVGPSPSWDYIATLSEVGYTRPTRVSKESTCDSASP